MQDDLGLKSFPATIYYPIKNNLIMKTKQKVRIKKTFITGHFVGYTDVNQNVAVIEIDEQPHKFSVDKLTEVVTVKDWIECQRDKTATAIENLTHESAKAVVNTVFVMMGIMAITITLILALYDFGK